MTDLSDIAEEARIRRVFADVVRQVYGNRRPWQRWRDKLEHRLRFQLFRWAMGKPHDQMVLYYVLWPDGVESAGLADPDYITVPGDDGLGRLTPYYPKRP